MTAASGMHATIELANGLRVSVPVALVTSDSVRLD